jgi:hypothetical protein
VLFRSPLTHSGCRLDKVAGSWRYGSMRGYTSRGVGASRVAARFFCRGEIVVHVLRRTPPAG